MNIIDEEFMRHPFVGTRRMVYYIKEKGYQVNRKRIQRLYQLMGLSTVYPKKNLSQRDKAHKIYPYLLKDLAILHCNQVWSCDITYVRLSGGFVYLFAVIDWFSRYVLDWEISNTLEADFCIETLKRILTGNYPEIFNTDQGSQFTCSEFIDVLLSHDIKISMDGKGRALDNIFIERLWRSVKYECIYLHEIKSIPELIKHLSEYFHYYNYERRHQSLDYQTPAMIYLKE